MFQILIVDDEAIIRQGLIRIIEKMGFPITGFLQAEDGDEAQKIFQEQQPDIIITDIKMHRIGGIEFIAQARQQSHRSQFIILSGYNDFEYAKQAIQHNVVAYLLKPVNKEELRQALTKAFDNCRESIRLQSMNRQLLNHFFQDCILNHQKEIDYQQQFHRLACPLPFSGFVCAYLVLPRNQTISFTAAPFFLQVAEYRSFGENLNIVFNIEKEAVPQLSAFLEKEIQEKNSNVFCGLSTWAEGFDALPRLSQESKTASISRFLSREKSLCAYRRSMDKKVDCSMLSWYYAEMEVDIRNQDLSSLSSHMGELFNRIQSIKEFTPASMLDVLHDLYTARFSILFDTEDEYKNVCLSCTDRRHLTQTLLMHLNDHNASQQNPAALLAEHAQNPKVKSALRYISLHYQEIRCIGEVAQAVGVSDNYLSRAIKSELDMSFSEYLLQTRLFMAKKLLSDPQYKIYEVAYLVGINDEKYFFKLFKKHFGVTPTQYRSACL